jgi:CBS domain protein
VSQRDLFHSALLRALGYGAHARESALDFAGIEGSNEDRGRHGRTERVFARTAKIMLDRKIGCLVVAEGTRIVGILTESDFVKLASNLLLCEGPV